MRPTVLRPVLLLVVLLPLLSGCFYSREIASTQRSIAAQNPDVVFDRQFMFSAGPGTINTLAGLASYVRVDEALLGSDYLRKLRKVKVGVYAVEDAGEHPLVLHTVPQLRRGGWQTLARFRGDDGDNVTLLYRERFGEIRDLFFVALSHPELVIVRATGNLTEMVVDGLRDFSEYIPQPGVLDEEKEESGAEATGVSPD